MTLYCKLKFSIFHCNSYDATPSDYISMIITEYGMVSWSKVHINDHILPVDLAMNMPKKFSRSNPRVDHEFASLLLYIELLWSCSLLAILQPWNYDHCMSKDYLLLLKIVISRSSESSHCVLDTLRMVVYSGYNTTLTSS